MSFEIPGVLWRRDPEAAERAMRIHLRSANKTILQNFENLLQSSQDKISAPYSDRRSVRHTLSITKALPTL